MVFKRVGQFNREILNIDRFEIKPLEKDELEWLLNALREEVKEAEDAESVEDFVDAMLDLIYFAAGGLHRAGLRSYQAEMCFDIVHAANMAKTRGVKESRLVQHELDAVKPQSWVDPKIKIRELLGC